MTTVSLDAVSHMHVHDDHGHEYECPFSNNKVIETDLSDPIKRVEFSPILVAEFSQKNTITQQQISHLNPEHLQKSKSNQI